MANNAYLLRDTATGEALLIDAAADPEALLALIGDGDAAHRRHHARALGPPPRAARRRLGDRRGDVAHAADAADLPVPVHRTVEHGDTVTFGEQTLEVSTCAATRRAASPWSGAGPATPASTCSPATACSPAASATRKDAARFACLIDDVEERLFDQLPDETWVYPGHGKDTTLGAERPHLGEWRARGW